MKEINTLIIGATAFACGLASQLTGDCLVVDGGFSAGAEFSDAMMARPIDTTREYSGAAQSLLDELKARNIVNERGELHILALAGVFARRFLDAGARILLGASVISVDKTGNGMLATIFTPEEGYTHVLARRVIDTRVRSFMDARKSFSVMLAKASMSSELADFDAISRLGGVTVRKGSFDDEYILCFAVERDCTLPAAQELSDRWLLENRTLLRGMKAASIALEFGYDFDEPLELTREGVRYIPSASYHDALEAFAKGAELWL